MTQLRKTQGAPAGQSEIRPKPLTARSVLASALLGEDPPELPVAHLVHLAGLFGISGNRARVALSRMVASGEATTDGEGRYRLAGHLLERRRRQEASLAGWRGRWEGGWLAVVVTAQGAPSGVRAARRRAFAFARLGALREGIWLRPDNLAVSLPPEVAAEVERFSTRPEGDPVALAGRLWDLEGWAARAEALVQALLARPTSSPADLAPGFELAASVLRHLQADPLLPAQLLPPGWPGEALRAEYRAFDVGYRATLREWGRSAQLGSPSAYGVAPSGDGAARRGRPGDEGARRAGGSTP